MTGSLAGALRDSSPLPAVYSFGSLLDYDRIAHSRIDWRIPKGERFSILVINKFREMCSSEVAENDARWPLHFNGNAELRDRAIALVLVTIQVPSPPKTREGGASMARAPRCSITSIFRRRHRGDEKVIENVSYGRVGPRKAVSSPSFLPSKEVVRTTTLGRKIHEARREERAAFRRESEKRMGSAGLRVLQSRAAKPHIPGGAKSTPGTMSLEEMMRREKMWRS